MNGGWGGGEGQEKRKEKRVKNRNVGRFTANPLEKVAGFAWLRPTRVLVRSLVFVGYFQHIYVDLVVHIRKVLGLAEN